MYDPQNDWQQAGVQDREWTRGGCYR